MIMRLKVSTLFVSLAIAVLFGVTPAQAQNPGPPEGIYAYGASPTAIMVLWGSPANVPDGFHLYRNNQLGANLAPNAGNFLDTKLSVNSSYTYRVCSFYGSDEYCTPDITASTAAAGGGSGDYAPPTVTGVVATSNSLTFSWSATPNYNFYQVRVAPKGQGDTQVTLSQSGHSGSFPYQQLNPSSQYTFKVQGCFSQLFNSTCSTWTQVEASTKAAPPSPPANFRATPISWTQINLSWKPMPGVIRYQMSRIPGPLPWGNSIQPNAVSVLDASLNPAITYSYTLCVTTGGGTACASATATPLAPPPAPPPLLLLAPINVSASGELANQAAVFWAMDRNSRAPAFFEVDHRVGIAPNLDTGASPWVPMTGDLPPSTYSFSGGSFPPLNGPLHHMFRVCAVDQWSRACSGAVLEKPFKFPQNIVIK